uniref:Secreted protein n=1 Tax=Anopheles darlingi TaxID=43151 RepID=A0A2M4DAY7_ANODA
MMRACVVCALFVFVLGHFRMFACSRCINSLVIPLQPRLHCPLFRLHAFLACACVKCAFLAVSVFCASLSARYLTL